MPRPPKQEVIYAGCNDNPKWQGVTMWLLVLIPLTAMAVVLSIVITNTIISPGYAPIGLFKRRSKAIDITDKVVAAGGNELPDGLRYYYRARGSSEYRHRPIVYIRYKKLWYASYVDTNTNDGQRAVLNAARKSYHIFKIEYDNDSRFKAIEHFVNSGNMTKIIKSEKAYED